MEVASSGAWRYPEAVSVERDGEWWVEMRGEPESVIPRGVVRDDDFGNKPQRMRWTIHESFESLRLAVTEPSVASAAEALAVHASRHFAVDLCGHGLPWWHDGSQCTGGLLGRVDGKPAQSVASVRRFVEFMDGIADAVEQVSMRRRPLTRRQAGDLLGYLPLAIEPIVRAELNRDGHIELHRARPLVRSLIDALASASGLMLSTRWPAQRRPQIALVAQSSTALYVADFLMDLGQPSGALVCSICGNVFTPRRSVARPGLANYCQRVECQRKRLAQNQARYRERKKKGAE